MPSFVLVVVVAVAAEAVRWEQRTGSTDVAAGCFVAALALFGVGVVVASDVVVVLKEKKRKHGDDDA